MHVAPKELRKRSLLVVILMTRTSSDDDEDSSHIDDKDDDDDDNDNIQVVNSNSSSNDRTTVKMKEYHDSKAQKVTILPQAQLNEIIDIILKPEQYKTKKTNLQYKMVRKCCVVHFTDGQNRLVSNEDKKNHHFLDL